MPVPMPTPVSRGSSRTMLAKSVLPGSPACPEGTVSAQQAGRELSAPVSFLVRGARRPCCAQPPFTPQLTRDFCSSPRSLPQPSSGSARTEAEGPGGAAPKQQQERAVLETPLPNASRAPEGLGRARVAPDRAAGPGCRGPRVPPAGCRHGPARGYKTGADRSSAVQGGETSGRSRLARSSGSCRKGWLRLS